MRAKKTFKNLIFNLLQQVVAIITNFIVPPLIIGKFGSAVNGLVSTIKQIMQHAQLTGAGISNVSTYALYKPLAENDYKKISGIYNATNKMFIKAGNYFSLILLVVAIVCPFFVQEELSYLTVALLVLIIGINGLSELYIIGKYQALLDADQKNFMIAIAQMVGNICNIIMTVVLIKLNQPIVVVQLGAAIVYVMRVTILTLYIKKNYSYINKKEKPLMESLSQKNDAVIHSVTALIINSSSTIIIFLFCGPAVASIYSVYALVFSGLNTICSIVSNAIYASFGEVIAKKDTNTLLNAYNIYEWIYLVSIGIIFSVTYLLIIPFIEVYTRNVADINYILPGLGILFVIIGIINNIKIPARGLVNASGHFKQTRNRSLIEMILNIVGQVICVPIFGIYGALIGALPSYIYRTIDFVIYTNKNILHINNKRSTLRIFINILVGIMAILIAKIIPIYNKGYVELVLSATYITVFVGAMYLIVNYILEKDTFKETVKVLKNVLIKQKQQMEE